MPNFNRVLLIGEVAALPEVLRADAPAFHVTFPLTTTRARTASGASKHVTDVHRVVVAGESAKPLLDALAVGTVVFVDGELINRGLVREGERRFITEVHTDRVEIIAPGEPPSRRPRR